MFTELAVTSRMLIAERLVDYVYVSFTNSIAFSPTDAMPLTGWAKLLMLSELAVSLTG
jgi:hypothetical protein